METGITSTSASCTSSVFDTIASFTGNFILFITETDQEILTIKCGFVLVILGTAFYVWYKVKDFDIKNKLTNEKKNDLKNLTKNFDYQNVLRELHDASDNCSNIFGAMKCVQLTSKYPELINVELFPDGVTPFHRVCSNGNVPLIELMVAKGANLELETICGENALCMALYCYLYSDYKDFNCLDLLYHEGCYLNHDWHNIFLNLAIKANDGNLTKWIFSHSKLNTSKFRSSSMPPTLEKKFN